jgi:hypothetical protein
VCGAHENSKIAKGIPAARVKAMVRILCRDIPLWAISLIATKIKNANIT